MPSAAGFRCLAWRQCSSHADTEDFCLFYPPIELDTDTWGASDVYACSSWPGEGHLKTPRNIIKTNFRHPPFHDPTSLLMTDRSQSRGVNTAKPSLDRCSQMNLATTQNTHENVTDVRNKHNVIRLAVAPGKTDARRVSPSSPALIATGKM